ncbi:MAG TPA: ABC transporter ATP-binding protein [Solirubrobacteraceae bacterium]|nr:ABC transporter ATP-binding protein [Solirubrobacteraceae bacterium]
MSAPPLLEVRDLQVRFPGAGRPVRAVDGASLTVGRGERVGLVGGSGSGKSVTALSVMGLIRPPARVTGELRFDGADLLRMPAHDRRRLRGERMAMVFQNPLGSLNPAMTVGEQIIEAITTHRPVDRRAARRRAVELLTSVGIPSPASNVDEHPHRFSGGMRQRAMLAMALSCEPDLLIADEPTTALDVRVQAQIVDLLLARAQELGMAVLFITHDMALLAGFAERLVVMSDGRVLEEGPVDGVYAAPSHPYTKVLVGSVPRIDEPRRPLPPASSRAASSQLLIVDGLVKDFAVARGVLRRARRTLRAVDDVSFELGEGETLGLVGESGAGKSTAARCILRLTEPTAGRVIFGGADLRDCGRNDLRRLRREMQIVFQDPYESLNPRMQVERLIAEPLRFHRVARSAAEARRRVGELLELVGLPATHARRYPRELSGGERQRVAIARAIAPHPRLLVLDEPVSSLDVSIRVQVLRLLDDLQRELRLSYLLIAHDLSLVRRTSDRVAVMRDGRLVEQGAVEDVFCRPRHPYTRALLDAVPVPDPAVERERRLRRIEAQRPARAGRR